MMKPASVFHKLTRVSGLTIIRELYGWLSLEASPWSPLA